LDLEGGFLRRGGEEVRLAPKPFQLLAHLVEHHNCLVTKATLIEAIWPDAAVTDNSLAQSLLEVRRALGDDSQQLIRTVARRGYLFTAPVTTPVLEFPHQPTSGPTQSGSVPGPPHSSARKTVNRRILGASLVLTAIAAAGLLLVHWQPPRQHEVTYTQITNFTDSAVAPALSPDGRMVAFFRSDDWLPSPDQVYIKLLPDGEPVQLTRDPRLKCCLAFSPEGSRIA
jgi:DNA-binding winged helix-turn-helix (wHTH) protein